MPLSRPNRWVNSTGPLTGAEKAARWRKRHPERYLATARKHARKHRDKILTYQRSRYAEVYARGRALIDGLKSSPCVDCGIQYPPYVMEFDHVRGKKYKEVGVMWGYSLKRIQAEIAKCELVCANCHRVRTFTRGQYRPKLAKEEE